MTFILERRWLLCTDMVALLSVENEKLDCNYGLAMLCYASLNGNRVVLG